MAIYISILRGINVSGHRLIKMDALKQICRNLGFEHVQTYIQSGNIIFSYTQSDPEQISLRLQEAIKKEFGFDVPVITMTIEDLEHIIASNPFLKDKKKDPAFFHITFLPAKPPKERYTAIPEVNNKNELFTLCDRTIYLYCPDGYGNSKLTNSFFETKLGTTATTRNWKTANTLLGLAHKIR